MGCDHGDARSFAGRPHDGDKFNRLYFRQQDAGVGCLGLENQTTGTSRPAKKRPYDLRGKAPVVHSLTLRPKSTLLAIGDEGGRVYLHDAATNVTIAESIHVEYQPGWVRAITFSPDGKTVAAGGGGCAE